MIYLAMFPIDPSAPVLHRLVAKAGSNTTREGVDLLYKFIVQFYEAICKIKTG